MSAFIEILQDYNICSVRVSCMLLTIWWTVVFLKRVSKIKWNMEVEKYTMNSVKDLIRFQLSIDDKEKRHWGKLHPKSKHYRRSEHRCRIKSNYKARQRQSHGHWDGTETNVDRLPADINIFFENQADNNIRCHIRPMIRDHLCTGNHRFSFLLYNWYQYFHAISSYKHTK